MRYTGTLAMIVAVLGVIAVALMLFGARFGLWQPITGFGFYRTYMTPLGAIVAAIGLLALIVHISRHETGGMVAGGVAMIVGLAILTPTIIAKINPPQRAAPIHDITTDTANPPAFELLDDSRKGASNTLTYGGPELAAAQATAYPDIAPLETDMPVDAAYERALAVAGEMGWDIVGSDPARHRFEATAHTAVFHFADDIVVVVSGTAGGSRVDMRSVSRIGRSDLGVNAARIRDFQERFGG
ncbi:DUF1499 domain-containing protein [Falsirhodobacter algicola]|uniref:DUF1499 domain-containing protein n=1 Tax=Falsirhodobacter algicola TaxID=2692330 RepID=A0A8J8MTY8_9RHOB|nr:DUF1499 domain-containing protein [Falsirhodobacter algicola]QUS36198.1 DUF1499 domain-containing protein [Falsirhodobacter algicola]